MKQKTNHSEALISLKARYDVLVEITEEKFEAWLEAERSNEDRASEVWEDYKSYNREKECLEREIKFHQIMLQEMKYATYWMWSDAHAYEIIEELSDCRLSVRQLKATLKPEAKEKLHESFQPGGFCGHFNNGLQEWDFESVEDNPIEIIRKHKDGRWYATGKRRFTIEAEPYEFYDFNF